MPETARNPLHRGAATRSAKAALLCAVALFLIVGLILIPLAGIQDDEALFAAPLFTAPFLPYTIRLLGHHLPLMVFSYTGALKTYLYWPVFKLFTPGPYSLRLPVLLAGTITILLLFYFARRIAGTRAALFAAILLATDPTFLMSNTFDWGPVALQHLLLMAGLCLAVAGSIVSACFVFGLALWEKSVFLWALAGLIAGGWAAYHGEIGEVLRSRGRLNKRRVASATLAFVIGASPLILYNIKSRNETVRTTAHFSLEHLPVKIEELSRALKGNGLFRFIAAEEWETSPKAVDSAPAKIADAVHDVVGDRRSSLFLLAAGLAALAVPLLWRTPSGKPALFALVFSAVTFGSMAITRDAGEAIHHTVLLWPIPQLLVGIALASIPRRWLSAMLLSVLAVSNLLVVNQYIFQLGRYGADGGFTDALYPLSRQLPVAADDDIYVMDWGLTEALTLLHRGRLALLPAADPFVTTAPDEAGTRMIANMLGDPHGLFVGHVRHREVFTGVSDRLQAAANAAGYRKQVLRTVPDSNGRPVFEIFRFAR